LVCIGFGHFQLNVRKPKVTKVAKFVSRQSVTALDHLVRTFCDAAAAASAEDRLMKLGKGFLVATAPESAAPLELRDLPEARAP